MAKYCIARPGGRTRTSPHTCVRCAVWAREPTLQEACSLGRELHTPTKTTYFTCAFDDLSGQYDGRDAAMQSTWHRRFSVSKAELERVFRR